MNITKWLTIIIGGCLMIWLCVHTQSKINSNLASGITMILFASFCLFADLYVNHLIQEARLEGGENVRKRFLVGTGINLKKDFLNGNAYFVKRSVLIRCANGVSSIGLVQDVRVITEDEYDKNISEFV